MGLKGMGDLRSRLIVLDRTPIFLIPPHFYLRQSGLDFDS